MLGPAPLIDPTAKVERCALGRYTEVGARTSLIETELGDYSYVVNDAEVDLQPHRQVLLDRGAHAHQSRRPSDGPRLAEPFHLSRQRLLCG